MKIKELFETNKTVFSFEIFPPNDKFPIDKFYDVINDLSQHKPDFISVTYGAGGSKRNKTVEIASHIKNNLNIETVAHLTCVGSTKEEIQNILAQLKANNIKNILALRGDIPKGETEEIFDRGDFKYSSDLIQEIKNHKDFSIAAAFYPEVHHETNDILDLIHLKNKVEKGADFLISQVFFDNNTFYKFKENAEKIGVNAPLVAGIMPVTNAAQIRRITELCHCAVPKKLENLLDKFGHDDESMYKAGVVYAAEQIIELVSNDVKGIHLYTMNRSQAVTEILNMVNFVRK